MMLHRELAVGLFEVLRTCFSRHPEGGVVVLLRHVRFSSGGRLPLPSREGVGGGGRTHRARVPALKPTSASSRPLPRTRRRQPCPPACRRKRRLPRTVRRGPPAHSRPARRPRPAATGTS